MKIANKAITNPDVSNSIVPVIISGAQNAVTTTAACGITNYNTIFTTSVGAIAPTLADGAITGQLRRFQFITDGGHDAVLTPATAFQGGATIITFADVGDVAELMWNGAAWQILALYNCADGATAPVAS